MHLIVNYSLRSCIQKKLRKKWVDDAKFKFVKLHSTKALVFFPKYAVDSKAILRLFPNLSRNWNVKSLLWWNVIANDTQTNFFHALLLKKGQEANIHQYSSKHEYEPRTAMQVHCKDIKIWKNQCAHALISVRLQISWNSGSIFVLTVVYIQTKTLVLEEFTFT